MDSGSHAQETDMRPLLFVDTETTGLRPGYHEIVELCMVKLDHETAYKIEFPHRTEQTRYYLALPKHIERIDPKAIEVNGFSIAQWITMGAIDIDSVLDEISEFMTDCTVVGFNPWFDLRFLIALFGENQPKFNYHAIDLCSVAYPLKIAGKIKSVSAKGICEFFGIDYSDAHTASEDVDLSIECYRRLLNYYAGSLP